MVDGYRERLVGISLLEPLEDLLHPVGVDIQFDPQTLLRLTRESRLETDTNRQLTKTGILLGNGLDTCPVHHRQAILDQPEKVVRRAQDQRVIAFDHTAFGEG